MPELVNVVSENFDLGLATSSRSRHLESRRSFFLSRSIFLTGQQFIGVSGDDQTLDVLKRWFTVCLLFMNVIKWSYFGRCWDYDCLFVRYCMFTGFNIDGLVCRCLCTCS